MTDNGRIEVPTLRVLDLAMFHGVDFGHVTSALVTTGRPEIEVLCAAGNI